MIIYSVKTLFIIILSSVQSESRSRRLVLNICSICLSYFYSHFVLSVTPTCSLLSHFSNCPPGLRYQSIQNVDVVVLFCFALLGHIVLEEVVYLWLFVKMFLTRKYDCQTGGGRRKLINQGIHVMWNSRHQ